jgi:hypothetical protein
MILGLRLCGGGGTMNFAFGLAPMLGLLLAEINERRKRHAPVIFRHSVWRGHPHSNSQFSPFRPFWSPFSGTFIAKGSTTNLVFLNED